MALKTMLQFTYPSLSTNNFKKKRYWWYYTTAKMAKDGIKLVCTDGYKKRYYFVLVSFRVDYKEQVFFTSIKVNMQCSICQVLPKEKKLVTRLWNLWTHQSIWIQLKWQYNDPAIERIRAVDGWFHQQKCSTWDHKYINLYAIVLLDILHIIYKSIMTNLVDWIIKSITEISI